MQPIAAPQSFPFGIMTDMGSVDVEETNAPVVRRRTSPELPLLCLAVFLSPYLAFRHPSLFLTAGDVFFGLAFAIQALRGFPRTPLGATTALWFGGFILLGLTLLVSSIVNGEPDRGFIVLVQYFFAFVCLPLMLLARPRNEVLALLRWAVMGMLAMCVFGIVIWSTGYNGGDQRHFMLVSGARRLAGFVDNPNGLAALITLNLPLIWLLNGLGAIGRMTAFVATLTLLVALVLTSSNTGMLGICAAAAVNVLGTGRVKIIAGSAVGIALIMGVLFLGGTEYLPEIFRDRVLNAIIEGDTGQAGTFDDRWLLMVEAWKLMPDYQLIGMGVDQYREISNYGLPVHNTYLLLATEGGLGAVLGFLVLMGAAVLAPLGADGNPDRRASLLATVTIVMVLMLVAMTFTHVYARCLVAPILLAIGPASALYEKRG